MASTRTLEIPDSTSGVLDGLRAQQSSINSAEIDKLRLAVAWAGMHSTDTLVQPLTPFSEQPLELGGPGAPEVAEFCVPELAITLRISHDSAAAYLGDAVDLAYRLTATYAQVLDGRLPVWKARRIAQNTRCLSLDAARFVDTHLAPVAHTLTWAGLDRLVEEAQVRFDPEAAEAARVAAAEQRCFDVYLSDAGHTGTVSVSGTLDLADALDLEAAVAAGATELAALGNQDSLDVRRSLAVGVLARRDLTLDLSLVEVRAPRASKPRPARQVVIHVHVSDRAVATVEGLGCVTVDQVKDWCTNPDTQVVLKPVIDLNATPTTPAYAVPDAMRDQVVLRDRTCAFPRCGRTARRCGLDHLVPWHQGGPTTPANLAPLCRRHHRLKTHGGWTYRRRRDGSYQWTSPHQRRRNRRPTRRRDHRRRP